MKLTAQYSWGEAWLKVHVMRLCINVWLYNERIFRHMRYSFRSYLAGQNSMLSSKTINTHMIRWSDQTSTLRPFNEDIHNSQSINQINSFHIHKHNTHLKPFFRSATLVIMDPQPESISGMSLYNGLRGDRSDSRHYPFLNHCHPKSTVGYCTITVIEAAVSYDSARGFALHKSYIRRCNNFENLPLPKIIGLQW